MIYCFLANGFEEMEAIVPVDMLRRCEKDVLFVGVGDQIISSAHQVNICADILAPEVVLDETLEMIILPGGSLGTLNLEKNIYVQKAIDYCVENNKPIGAICAAPSILGHKNLLEGRNATCYPGFDTQLFGANYTGNLVEIDGNFITAKGPGASLQFGLALCEKLLGKERVDLLVPSLQCS